MSEANKAVVRRIMKAADEQNDSVLDELVDSRFIAHIAGLPDADKATWRKNVAMFYEAFSGLEHPPDDMIAEGDKVSVRATFSGTHTGSFLGVPATGRSVKFQAYFIMKIVGGKAVEEWGNFDMLGLMQQIGAIPTPG